ncbi:hypothetical protein EDC04DRAFT_2908195 [Pisolithus marmoratus]|nr:hypothetical protein EDC04DRAFT_2908195 [Pisolithus marmoratus]
MDPGICQHLFEVHIPVWLIWKLNNVPEDMRVLKEVEVTCPDDIVMDPENVEVSQVLKWNGGWCYPSDARHLHTREGAVIGLEQFARPWPEPNARSSSSTMASTPTSMGTAASNPASSSSVNANPPAGSKPRAKPSITPNAELWEDLDDPAIPPAMSTWHAALKDVNKDAKRVHPDAPKIAYFFPHPALFVRGESSDRRQRYLRNWLVSRVGWITRLSASDSSPITPRSWRDFLNTIPKQISSMFSGDRLREAANLFGPELIRVQHDIPSQVQFRDISISLADLASMDRLTKSKILWDLYEHNFQFKLVTLSRALMPSSSLNEESEWLDLVHQIFPGDLELTMCTEPFPGENRGLGSSDLQSKCEYMERLRSLLALWLGFPPDLVEPLPPSALSACVWAVERKLAAFYVQCFFDNFGHLPILPRFIPVSSHDC